MTNDSSIKHFVMVKVGVIKFGKMPNKFHKAEWIFEVLDM